MCGGEAVWGLFWVLLCACGSKFCGCESERETGLFFRQEAEACGVWVGWVWWMGGENKLSGGKTRTSGGVKVYEGCQRRCCFAPAVVSFSWALLSPPSWFGTLALHVRSLVHSCVRFVSPPLPRRRSPNAPVRCEGLSMCIVGSMLSLLCIVCFVIPSAVFSLALSLASGVPFPPASAPPFKL